MFVTLLICSLLVPSMMLVFGFILYKHPPKERNSAFGYRTPAAKRSAESWDFAQRYCGRLWLFTGAAMLAVTLIVMGLMYGKPDEKLAPATTALMIAQTALTLLTIIPVEVALRRRFNKDGSRKD